MMLSKIYQEKAAGAKRDIVQGKNVATAHSYLARLQWCEKHADSLLNRFPEIISISPGQKAQDTLGNWQIGNSIYIDIGGIKSFDARWAELQEELQEALIEAGWTETVSYAYSFLDLECCLLQRQLEAHFDDFKTFGFKAYGAMRNDQGVYIAADLKSREKITGLWEDSIKKALQRFFPGVPIKYHWPAP